MFAAKVILDSVGPNQKRLITVEATYPRFVHAEVMTHRDRARNAASSRAIPWIRHVKKDSVEGGSFVIDTNGQLLHPKCMKSMILSNPVVPIFFGKEQKGMQVSEEELSHEDKEASIQDILDMRDFCVERVQRMANRGLHKSICNRYTEPWMWITTLMTATEWKNFFRLRCHPDAEKHFQKIAGMIRDAINKSKPTQLQAGGWHAPYIEAEDEETIKHDIREGVYTKIYTEFYQTADSHWDAQNATFINVRNRISAARCARLSYLTHDGVRDHAEDIRLFDKLINRTDDVIHSSPLEHVAQATNRHDLRSGPFNGWLQLRKLFANENVEG